MNKNVERLYYVELPHACYGIVSINSKIVAAAPIAKWMIGKSTRDAFGWIKMKKGKIFEIEVKNE